MRRTYFGDLIEFINVEPFDIRSIWEVLLKSITETILCSITRLDFHCSLVFGGGARAPFPNSGW